MIDDDMFKPYSPETRGDLEEYLKSHDGFSTSNLFFNPDYFFVMKEKGFIDIDLTYIRLGNSPAPDIMYGINENYMLKGEGVGHMNMSLIGAKEGVYDPKEVLKGRYWSIYHLDI